MAKNDLFTKDIPTGAAPPRNPADDVLESPRMSLAPVPTPASVPGAVPPQNLEAEESVLGAMMISGNAIAAVTEIVDASDFYRESHAKIYRAALQLYGKNEPVDAITLTNELEQRGELDEIGGRVRLHELARLVPATANARHYAEIVRETATLRGLILAGGQIAQLGWDREGEPTELVARAEQLVFELGERRAEGELVLFKDALLEAFQTINKLYESGAEVTGLASGFKDLDRITGGFQPANLVIIAARPSMERAPSRGIGRLGSRNPHRDEFRRPLPVFHHLMRQIEQQIGEGPAEIRKPRIVREPDARRSARSRGAGGEQQERVARRRVAVDGDGVEGGVAAESKDLTQRPRLDRRVGEEESEHGRHVRRDHACALGDAVNGNGHALDLGLPRGELGIGVGGHDSTRSIPIPSGSAFSASPAKRPVNLPGSSGSPITPVEAR